MKSLIFLRTEPSCSGFFPLSPLFKPGCSKLRPITRDQAVDAVLLTSRKCLAHADKPIDIATVNCGLEYDVYDNFNFFNPVNMLNRSMPAHYTVRISQKLPGKTLREEGEYSVSSCGVVNTWAS